VKNIKQNLLNSTSLYFPSNNQRISTNTKSSSSVTLDNVNFSIGGSNSKHPHSITVETPQRKLKANERGLVISSPVKIEGSSLSFGGGFDEQLVKSSLLFWDVFDWPSNRFFYQEPSDGIKFLINEGIIVQSNTNFTGNGDGAKILLESHLSAYRALEKESPGLWSLAKGEGSISFPEEEMEKNRGILFELHETIPVPSLEVPYEDILNYKVKRHDELVALRHHLEEVYQLIANSYDIDLSKHTQFEKLDRALKDHIRTSQESGMKLKLSGIKASIDVGDIIKGGFLSLGALSQGLPLSASVLAGFTSALSLKTGVGLAGKSKSSTPFEYVSSIHKDLN